MLANPVQYTFIVPTINRFSELVRFLNSVQAQSVKAFEVIILDQNGPSSNVANISSRYEFVNYMHSKIKGLSVNRNIGIRAARGNWIIISDDDCVLSHNYLLELDKYINYKDAKAKIFYGNVLNIEDSRPYNYKLSGSDRALHFYNFDKVCSIGFIFHKDIFVNVGFFDESFGVGARYGACEESDLILRALYNNYSAIYISSLKIYHPRMISNKFSNLNKGISYSYGFGAFYKKGILSYQGKLKRILLQKYLWSLFITFSGLVINISNTKKRTYYFYCLRSKLRGFRQYKN